VIRNRLRTFLISAFTILIIFGAGCRGMFFNVESTYLKNLKLVPYDALIVPGVPFENGNWNFIMKSRVLWSVYLYQQGYAKNIIYSGSAVYSPFIEAKIMALYAEKMGIPPEHIFVEPRAEHSTENVYYSCLIAKKNGFKSVAVATDKFQSRTLADFLPKVKRKTDIDIKSLPIQDEWLQTMQNDDPKINYELAKIDSFISLVDRESKLKRLWGTLGMNIKYEKNEKTEHQSDKSNATN
jgi:uncharacterized SAM-binding protein YcdF (DUF218 family)